MPDQETAHAKCEIQPRTQRRYNGDMAYFNRSILASLLLVSLLSVPLSFVPGCGPSSGHANPGDLDAYVSQFEDALCKLDVACGAMPDVATCMASLQVDSTELATLRADIASGKVRFDAVKAGACIDYVRRIYGGACTRSAQAAADPTTGDELCSAFLVGSVAEGGACFSAFECASANVYAGRHDVLALAPVLCRHLQRQADVDPRRRRLLGAAARPGLRRRAPFASRPVRRPHDVPGAVEGRGNGVLVAVRMRVAAVLRSRRRRWDGNLPALGFDRGAVQRRRQLRRVRRPPRLLRQDDREVHAARRRRRDVRSRQEELHRHDASCLGGTCVRDVPGARRVQHDGRPRLPR